MGGWDKEMTGLPEHESPVACMKNESKLSRLVRGYVFVRHLNTRLPLWWSQTLFPTKKPASTRYDRRFWLGLIVLLAVSGSVLFPHLSYPLVEPDEGRYAEIPREMLRSGDWLVPTLNYEPYYDKPPLLYWLVAASLHTFGVHAWATRLVPTSAALLSILATFLFARRMLGTRTAFLGALALSLMGGFMQCGRFLVLDSVLTCFVATSLFAAFEAVQGTRFRWDWWLASAAFCALGVLTKGPVALVLLGPPVAVFTWLQRDTARPRVRHWCAYAGIIAAVAAPWFVAVTLHDPEFAYKFFVEHHLKRFFGQEYHDSPFWFYVPVLLIGCLPWSTLLYSFMKYLFTRADAVRALRLRAMGFCLLWAAWCVLFFSLSRGKLPPYILPALPAVALLIGCTLEAALFQPGVRAFFEPARSKAPVASMVLLCLTLMGANAWAWSKGTAAAGSTLRVVLESGVALAGIMALILCGRRLPAKVAWALCCLLAFGVVLEAGGHLVPSWAALRSPLAQTETLRHLLDDRDTAVLCHGEEWGSIAFAVDHDAVYLNSKNRSVRQLQEFLGSHPRDLIIAKGDGTDRFLPLLMPPGMMLAKVLESGQAKIFVVRRSPAPSPGAPATSK
jgi:4-amino-4-deoxy-L-arabinose transferase-like glycosyltransferase